MNTSDTKTILMTAFEPSGDTLGAMAARGLRELEPTIRIVGLGGSQMESAGVELLAHTTGDAAMGLNALSEVLRVKRLVDMVRDWLKENKADVVVAVDSPAANFPVCKVARQANCKIVHLAAPQLWAWAPWRIRKMRRLTDHVMCLLPFEPEWFESRGVKATFIGHPAFRKHETTTLDLPTGSPNILLLPGSRASEIASNLPLQQRVLQEICLSHPTTEAAIACREEDVVRVTPLSNDLPIVGSQLSSALEWADLALTVSGTVSLHVMERGTPMIGMYKVGLISRIGASCLLNTPNRLLPNLIAGERVVPEFIPCGNVSHHISQVALELLDHPDAMEKQRSELLRMTKQYDSHKPSQEAAEIILSYAS